MDLAEAQVWYESQQSGLGAEFRTEISRVIDRLAETPLIYQTVHRDVRRAIVRRFPYLIWYRVTEEIVIVLAFTRDVILKRSELAYHDVAGGASVSLHLR